MSDKNADQIKALYTDLAKIGPSQDWERLLKVSKKSKIIVLSKLINSKHLSTLHSVLYNVLHFNCDFKLKVLGISVNEKKALHCKIVCLIQTNKFDEALTSIERAQDSSQLNFEKAYCEYRLNKIDAAYETLMKCNEKRNKEKELLAQVAYRLEKYQESYDAYRSLIKNTDVIFYFFIFYINLIFKLVYHTKDEFDNERQTNLSAVVASLRSSNSVKDLVSLSCYIALEQIIISITN
jgi:putative lipoic acid-binding regulatory protein